MEVRLRRYSFRDVLIYYSKRIKALGMKRIDLIGHNGNDGLHYTYTWLHRGEDFDEWDFDSHVAFTTGGNSIFFDKAIAGSPVPSGMEYYMRLTLPAPPKWERED